MKLNNISAIVVATLPKVGQSTVWHSCQLTFPETPVFRAQNIFFRKEIGEFVEKNARKRLAVVTGLREPVSWLLSYMVQEVNRLEPDLIGKHNTGGVSSEEVVATIRRYAAERKAWDYYAEWFDGQILKFTGMNILDYPFDHGRKFTGMENERFSVLAVRSEEVDHWDAYLAEFFGIQKMTMKIANTSLHKVYSGFYYDALINFSLPAEQLDAVYASKYVRHFYTPDEIDGFKERWRKPIPDMYAIYIRDIIKKQVPPKAKAS